MNRRKFIETSGAAAGATMLGGVTSAAKMGEENGVVMALQNHAPPIRHWKDTYDNEKRFCKR